VRSQALVEGSGRIVCKHAMNAEPRRQVSLGHVPKVLRSRYKAKHSINHGHCIQFHSASILATKTITIYMDGIVREAIEIERHPYTINREGGFCFSKSRKPLIGFLKCSGHDPRTLGDAVPHS
jgi:hypothetical protein